MTLLVRIALLKLKTMRLTYGLATVAATLTALFALLENGQAGSAGSGVPPISTAEGLRTVTTVTAFAMLMAAVVGFIAANGEFRNATATATLTYLEHPQRSLVLAAKAIAAAAVGLLFGLLAGVISTGIDLIFAAVHSDHLALRSGTLLGHIGGAMVGAALLAALGVGVGSRVPSQLATVIGIFASRWARQCPAAQSATTQPFSVVGHPSALRDATSVPRRSSTPPAR